MTEEIFESLLYENESSALDFKRDQYPFAGSTEEQKSELVKDILALANAWRRTTGYILIGVEEVQGGVSKVIGVINHLKEADLQQLVNTKTNRPVEFAYQALDCKGLPVGVIAVPVQQRPFYVRSDYGKLRANTVYIRRGSSTAVATPDEIARMGMTAATELTNPLVELRFADIVKRVAVGTNFTTQSRLAYFDDSVDIPRYGRESLGSLVNRNYYKDYSKYLGEKIFF